MSKLASLIVALGMLFGGFFLYLYSVLPELFGQSHPISNPRAQLLLAVSGLFLVIISIVSLPRISDQKQERSFIDFRQIQPRKFWGMLSIAIGICLIGILVWLGYVRLLESLQVIPHPVTDLSAQQIQGNWQEVPIVEVAASTNDGLTIAENMKDKNPKTNWTAPITLIDVEQTITIDLGESTSMGRISWTGSADEALDTPDDYRLSISNDRIEWDLISVGKAVDIDTDKSNSKQITIAPQDGRYLRLDYPMKRGEDLRYHLSIAEIVVYKYDPNSSNIAPVVALKWKEPAGGQFSRSSTDYEIRWSTHPFENESQWQFGSYISGTPPLGKPDRKERVIVELPESMRGETIYFSIRTTTYDVIRSRLSNTARLNVRSAK